MTKAEKEDLEALKIAYQMNEWEDFLLVLNEVRQRDKDLIKMYRTKFMKFKKALKELLRVSFSESESRLSLICGSGVTEVSESLQNRCAEIGQAQEQARELLNQKQ